MKFFGKGKGVVENNNTTEGIKAPNLINQYKKEENAVDSDENLIGLLEFCPDYYTYAIAKLSYKYPDMKAFAFPTNYLGVEASQNKDSDARLLTFHNVFNTMLTAFQNLLKEIPCLSEVLGVNPESINDLYYVREDEKKGFAKLDRLFRLDSQNYDSRQPVTFIKFVEFLEERRVYLILKYKNQNYEFPEIRPGKEKSKNKSVNSSQEKEEESLVFDR